MTVDITGTGAITCVGATAQALWQAAHSERSGIKAGVGETDSPTTKSKAVYLATTAIKQAMDQAGWTELRADDGFILATTTGQIPVWDKSLLKFLKNQLDEETFQQDFRSQPLGSLIDEIATALSFKGPSQLITTACSASTQAIALAAMWLKLGRVKRVLVGGVEVLCDLTVQGFKSLQLLSPSPTTPFDEARQGINLSEGAGFLTLELNAAKPLAHVSGYGMSTDAFHLTSPHPEGRGCYEAMSAALKVAKLSPSDISWIHAHGTGSRHNDAAEGAAINQLFGANQPITTSTKWVHGHALGASGAIETILCVEALKHQTILKTGGLKNADPQIPVRLTKENKEAKLDHVMKNTLGFGGANAALVLSRAGSTMTSVSTTRNSVYVLGTGTTRGKDLRHLLTTADFRKATRNMAMAFLSIDEALAACPQAKESPQTGFVLGTSHGEFGATRDFLVTLADTGVARPLLFQNSLHNSTLGFLSLKLKVTGPAITVSNHHFTGENAIETAMLLLKEGQCQFCIVTGVDTLVPDPVGGSAATLLLANEAGLKSSQAQPLAVLEQLDCARANKLNTQPIDDYYESDAIEHLAYAIRSSKTAVDLTKPDASTSKLRWRKP